MLLDVAVVDDDDDDDFRLDSRCLSLRLLLEASSLDRWWDEDSDLPLLLLLLSLLLLELLDRDGLRVDGDDDRIERADDDLLKGDLDVFFFFFSLLLLLLLLLL